MIDMTLKSLGVDDFTGAFKSFLIKKLYTQYKMVKGNLTEMLPGFKDVNSSYLLCFFLIFFIKNFSKSRFYAM